ncbi:MAG: ATP-binding protein [Oscillospiraceae bacterium]|nr:ATP-binding protein [Oscillospiraceae bacterium]
MFAGRDEQLKKLEGLYNSGKFECAIMHGRLRVGKTALIREFIKGKRAIYFSAQETNDRENQNALLKSIAAFPESSQNEAVGLAEFPRIAQQLYKLSNTQRLLLVIDDYHFLVASNREVSKIICAQIDKLLKNSQLMFLICGSSEPVMENETLSYDSPFHGRRTAQIKVEPFTFFETKRYYSGFSPYDIAVVYGLTGGIPGYIGLMDPKQPIEENIKQTFFNPYSMLFEEPANFLRREVRDPTYYNAVLQAIAAGCSKNSEISTAVGLETSACTAYLKNLISYGIVGKHTPVTERAGKKTAYGIEDSMFRFWYRFVPDNISQIRMCQVDKFWRKVATEIPSFMRTVFEDICREWIEQRNLAGRLPGSFVEIGRWWGVDPISKNEARLPIVAYANDDHALFGDCVWSDEPTDAEALVSLDERSRLFRFQNRYLFLFSRSGFSKECASLAGRIGASLVVFE